MTEVNESFVLRMITRGVAVSVVVRKFLIYQTTLSLYSLGVILLKSSFFENQIHGFLPLALVGFLAQAALVLLLFLFSVSRTFTTKLIQFFFWLLSRLHLVKRPRFPPTPPFDLQTP